MEISIHLTCSLRRFHGAASCAALALRRGHHGEASLSGFGRLANPWAPKNHPSTPCSARRASITGLAVRQGCTGVMAKINGVRLRRFFFGRHSPCPTKKGSPASTHFPCTSSLAGDLCIFLSCQDDRFPPPVFLSPLEADAAGWPDIRIKSKPAPAPHAHSFMRCRAG